MPKAKQSKKATPKQRQAPYPTPPRPTPDSRSSTAAPSIPGARIFPPPFASRWPRPDSAYLNDTLTPYEQRQSFLDFIKDRQNNTSRFPRVVEGEIPGDGQTPDNVEDKPGDPGSNNGDKPNAGGTLPSPGPFLPGQPPIPPEEPPCGPDLAILKPLTEDEMWLEKLKPVQEYNDATPWPIPFHEQPVPTPAWHAECPEGYEPTTLAGYPIRRQYDLCIPAAHDPDLVRDEYGHYCFDLGEWYQCCTGKCERCETCRQGL